MNNKYLINDQIHDQKVFVIDENGKNLGVMMTTEAMKLANSKDYDLVLFASAEKTKNLAICKIIKYANNASNTC